jgi:hypothetical protein
MQTLYPKPISYKKILYYLFYSLAWIGVIIGFLDLYISFAKKNIYIGTFAGFIWALVFFILAALAKKKRKKIIK